MINKILTECLTESERKTWQPTEQVYYAVGIKRSIGKGCFSERYFWRWFRERSDKFSSGETREGIRNLAGKTGRIFKHTVKTERIQ